MITARRGALASPETITFFGPLGSLLVTVIVADFGPKLPGSAVLSSHTYSAFSTFEQAQRRPTHSARSGLAAGNRLLN